MDYQQKSDNYDINEFNKKYNQEYFCNHYVENREGKIYNIAKICNFNSNLLNKKGFTFYRRINIENRFVDIYKKLPKRAESRL